MYPSVLLIDNHDSFTRNLAQLLDESGLCSYKVCFPEELTMPEVYRFDKILISPGPGVPSEYPSVTGIIQDAGKDKSILGICLGFQAIVEVFGGSLFNLPEVVHGIRRVIQIREPVDTLFRGIPSRFKAGLYHSWAARKDCLPSCLKITAESTDGIIMGVAHEQLAIRGVQFHPESYMTEYGKELISNWLRDQQETC